jgi:hypothetical protein
MIGLEFNLPEAKDRKKAGRDFRALPAPIEATFREM